MAIHHLNNIIHPILALVARVEEDPNVLVAKDDGMEQDALAKHEDEEIEPFEDDQGDGASDVDSDHSEAQLAPVLSQMCQPFILLIICVMNQ